MSQHASFLLLGLANGAVFAALGLALTVTYRSSGVMNFATSSMALFTAYMYSSLRRGELLLLVPGLPSSIELADSLPFLPSALLALAISALVGLLLYLIVFRPLRSAPVVARAVASLGVMVVMTGVMVQRQGTRPPPVERIFPVGNFSLTEDVTVSKDRVYFVLSVAAVAAAVWALTRFTRFGLATRAASSSEKGAYLSGVSPDRIAALNWVLSAVVCGVAGILIAPIVPLVPIQYTLFIVPALATAILGGFERVGPAVIGGLAVGMLQSEMAYLQIQNDWLPSSGLAELVPLALILLVLVVRAKPLPSRGVVLRQTLGAAPRPHSLLLPAAVSCAVGALALAVVSGSTRAALVTSLILAVISLSHVVVTGYSGQISLAQLTLAGVAGFLLGPITTTWRVPVLDAQLPFPLAPLAAALGAMVIGVVIGLPAVRLRGLPLAVVTLAMAVAVEAVWFRNTDLVTSSGRDVEGPTLFGMDLRIGSGLAYPRLSFCLLVLGVLVAVGTAVARLRTSRLGSAMLAVRANERSAAAAGINVVRTKVAAFAIGAFIAGLGGALLAYKQGNVTFSTFAVFIGLGLFATAYMAGITSVSGAVVAGLIGAGGIVFTTVDDHLSLGRWYATLGGVGLIFTVIQNPEGIVGPVHRRLERRRLRRADVAGRPAPKPVVAQPGERPAVDVRSQGDLLVLRDLSVHYDGVVALRDVTFGVPAGSIVGLIGPNGAGKTTLLDAVSGFCPASGGITLGGRDMVPLKPFQRSRAGIARTFQSIDLYDDMTVAENVLAGASTSRRQRKGSAEAVADALRLLGIEGVAERPAGELSQGTRQLVSIARALVGRPEILLLDEPAAGLDSTESAWLGDRLRDIRASGTTILLIDHDMHLVLGLCDEIRVLDFGALIASGPPDEVRADPSVAAAYLGSTTVAGATTNGGTDS